MYLFIFLKAGAVFKERVVIVVRMGNWDECCPWRIVQFCLFRYLSEAGDSGSGATANMVLDLGCKCHIAHIK